MKNTLVIVASGPSLVKSDIDYCRPLADVWVVNDNYRLAVWSSLLYACDKKWWDCNIKDVLRCFNGELWTRDRDAANQYGLNYIASINATGLSTTPGLIHSGYNSGYQAINMAFLRGYRRIVLLGYDMKKGRDNRQHWFGEHSQPQMCVPLPFDTFIGAFEELATDAKILGLHIINCTRDTALECFEWMPLKEALPC